MTPVTLDDASRALMKLLERCGANIHWIQISRRMHEPKTRVWPYESLPNVVLQPGWSEGTMAYVMSMANRYQPDAMVPELMCKFLGGRADTAYWLPTILAFAEGLDLVADGSDTLDDLCERLSVDEAQRRRSLDHAVSPWAAAAIIRGCSVMEARQDVRPAS